SILQKYGLENSSGGSTICAPFPAASSTKAETAAMFSCSSDEPRASCRAATVIFVMRGYLMAPRGGTRRLGPLAEQQRHPVCLADGVELGPARRAFGRAAIARRQRPHTAFPIRRVLRIGVDLALGDQIEAVGVEQGNHILLALIAVVAEGVACGRIGLGAVLHHADQTIIFEQLAGRDE